MTTQNEAAERTPHIFADDSIDADGAYCTRHEHWVPRNEPHTAEGRALVEECGECVTVDDVRAIEAAERVTALNDAERRVVAYWRERGPGYMTEKGLRAAILDEEATR